MRRGPSTRLVAATLAAATIAAPALALVPPAPGEPRAVPIQPPLTRPPAGPWLLVNTTATAPRVFWSGPALVLVDSPEALTDRLVRAAPGGLADAHLLYGDQTPDLPGTFWLFVYLHNALPQPVDVWFTVRSTLGQATDVRYAAGAAARVPLAEALAAGEQVAASLTAPTLPVFGPAQNVAAGGAATGTWRVDGGQLFSLWWPIEVSAPDGVAVPFSLSVWEGPSDAAPPGGALPPGRSGVVRTTVPHGQGSVILTAPTRGAWAYDLDNDPPMPESGAGGDVCPPFVCLQGEVTTAGGRPFAAAADPLPGEMEGGVDALDAPGHHPAVAVWHHGALLRTGNYGDYGTRLVLRLKAPAGRLVYAAAVPGYNRAAPWSGTTTAAGALPVAWQLPTAPPPPGEGYQLVARAASATITTTVTPGAYAPWRLVLWSEPRGGASGAQGP